LSRRLALTKAAAAWSTARRSGTAVTEEVA
jgi:hypothetical protein